MGIRFDDHFNIPLSEVVRRMVEGMGAGAFSDGTVAATDEGMAEVMQARDELIAEGHDNVSPIENIVRLTVDEIPEQFGEPFVTMGNMPVFVVVAAGETALTLRNLLPLLLGPSVGPQDGLDEQLSGYYDEQNPLPDPEEVDIDDELRKLFDE